MSKEREGGGGDEYGGVNGRRSLKRASSSREDDEEAAANTPRSMHISSRRPHNSSSSSSSAANIQSYSAAAGYNMQHQQQHQQQQQQLHIVPGGGGGAGSGGACAAVVNVVTPCAACKLLRRRCAQECPFAPYFSPLEPHKFASVHKIYGASNVSKMLMEVPESQRADTANSLVYEANARIRDPVYGCMGVISMLQQQARTLQAELSVVKGEMMRYRASHVENAVNLNLIQMATAITPPYNTATITHSSNPSLPGDNITFIAPSNSSATSADSSVKAERFWSTLG